MGDFNYSKMERDNKRIGVHSITFNGLNTWDTWHMAPKSRPFVVAPQVKTEYIDIPGADGSLDYTEVLTGKPRYASRTGQWDFIIDNGYVNWPDLYSDILMKLHGKYFDEIVLEDDPYYKWKGRLSVTGQFGNKDYSSVSISYVLDPYKRPLDSKELPNWMWKDLFGNTIFYGSFTVRGVKTHNILNLTDDILTATINCTNAIKVYECANTKQLKDMLTKYFDGYSPIWLGAGDNQFNVAPGENILVFNGNAVVNFTYERGKFL